MAQITLTGHSFGCIAFGLLLGATSTAAAAYGYIQATRPASTESMMISRCMADPSSFVEIKLPDGAQCSYAPSEKLLALPVGRPIVRGKK